MMEARFSPSIILRAMPNKLIPPMLLIWMVMAIRIFSRQEIKLPGLRMTAVRASPSTL